MATVGSHGPIRATQASAQGWRHEMSPALLVALVVATLGTLTIDAGVAAAGPGCQPQVIDLGTLGGSGSEVIETNALGVWVGSARDAEGVVRAVLWDGGRVQDLGVEGDAWAADINNRGDVVGNSKESEDGTTARAFRWRDGVATELPGLMPDGPTFVRRLNERGISVGSAGDAAGTETPVMWPASGGGPVTLAIPEGYIGGYGMAINDRGDVVGAAYSEFQLVAWAWDADGSNHALAERDLGGFSQANVVDNQRRAAGLSDFGGNPGAQATLWHRGGSRSLGVFGSSDFSFALGTNGQGDYVGIATYFAGEESEHVFLTSAASNGLLRTLMPLSGNPADSSKAHAVSSGNVAVGGSSMTESGDVHATVWTCAFDQAFVPDVGLAAAADSATSRPSISSTRRGLAAIPARLMTDR